MKLRPCRGQLHEVAHELTQGLGRPQRFCIVFNGEDLRAHANAYFRNDRPREQVLRFEVIDDELMLGACALGDLAQRRAVDAEGRKLLKRRLQYSPPPLARIGRLRFCRHAGTALARDAAAEVVLIEAREAFGYAGTSNATQQGTGSVF